MKFDFSFLSSIRFWKLFLIAVAQFLAAQSVIPTDIATAVTIWLGGSVAVNTVDRFSAA